MSILVRKLDSAWQEWHGDAEIQQMVSTSVVRSVEAADIPPPVVEERVTSSFSNCGPTLKGLKRVLGLTT